MEFKNNLDVYLKEKLQLFYHKIVEHAWFYDLLVGEYINKKSNTIIRSLPTSHVVQEH